MQLQVYGRERAAITSTTQKRQAQSRSLGPWTKRASGCLLPIWEAGKVGAGNTKVGSKSIRGGLYCVARSQLVNTYERFRIANNGETMRRPLACVAGKGVLPLPPHPHPRALRERILPAGLRDGTN